MLLSKPDFSSFAFGLNPYWQLTVSLSVILNDISASFPKLEYKFMKPPNLVITFTPFFFLINAFVEKSHRNDFFFVNYDIRIFGS